MSATARTVLMHSIRCDVSSESMDVVVDCCVNFLVGFLSLDGRKKARLKNGHARVEACALKMLACRKNVGGLFKHW